MKKPPASFLIVGHPIVAVPFGCLLAFMAYGVFTQPDSGSVGLIVLGLGGAVGHAAKVAAKWRAWEREWNAGDPDYKPWTLGRSLTTLKILVGAGLVGAGFLWLLANYSDASSSASVIAPVGLISLLFIWIASVVRRRLKQPQPTNRLWTVSQAASRPQPAPSVAEAYARLPDYVRPLFSPEQPRKDEP